MTVRILFDIGTGVGLGDAVQQTILFKHIRRYRPHWDFDIACHHSLMSCYLGCCRQVWNSEAAAPHEYDNVIRLNWTDVFETFPDRPSTKVAFALKNTFGINNYDMGLGRYEIPESEMLTVICPYVACHFKGVSHRKDKDLGGEDCEAIARGVANLGFVGRSISNQKFSETARIIRQANAFIGIDSGPGKIASATDTPSLICWTGHHPLRYHDPAPNTTHLIPSNWEFMPPFVGEVPNARRPGRTPQTLEELAADYFINNYKFITYRPGELAQEACRWLRETLK